MTGAALASELAPAAVPLIAQRVVDDAIRTGDRGALLPLAGLALLLGVLEALAVLVRRWVMSKAALGVETDLRRDLYGHLQALPVSFHDRWQSGQLLSRATEDLATVRRFFGFGLVFLVVNSTVCVVVGVLLFFQYWPLALLVLAFAVPLVLTVRRFELRYSRVSRRAQDLNGELTTSVEETAAGIRTIKLVRPAAAGAGPVPGQVPRRCAAAQLEKVTVLAYFWVVLEMLPAGRARAAWRSAAASRSRRAR